MKLSVVPFVLCCLLALNGTASAEQIYLRNRPFKGPVIGKGQATFVGLKAFAEAMNLSIAEQGGATLLHPKDVQGADFGIVNDPGGVYVVGVRLETKMDSQGQLMIPLFAAAEAAGFRAQHNTSSGTIDITLKPRPVVAAAESEPVAGSEATSEDNAGGDAEAAPKKARIPVKRGTVPGGTDPALKVLTPVPIKNINRPGETVDVREHLVKGHYNLVVFGANW